MKNKFVFEDNSFFIFLQSNTAENKLDRPCKKFLLTKHQFPEGFPVSEGSYVSILFSATSKLSKPTCHVHPMYFLTENEVKSSFTLILT